MQKLPKIFFHIMLLSILLSQVASATVFFPEDSAMRAQRDSSRKAARHANHEKNEQQEQGFQPVIRIGAGLLSYIGNVKSGAGTTNFQSPTDGRFGFDIGLSQRLSNVTEFSLNFLDGTLAETERTTDAVWNFQSNIVGGGFSFLFKILPKQDMTPYFIVGVETFGFSSNADINDNGLEYYTWSDGTLRSLPQNSPNAASAKVLNLSYNYSTDIRSLNLDGSGSYSQQTFAIPIGLGFMFRLADRTDFMVGSTLHYTFTDHIDGLTPQVQGPLQGTLSHDMFLFTYISLRIHLTKDRTKAEPAEEVTITPDLMNDTVHPAPPGHFDTSETVLQTQYQKFSDTSGQFAKVHVDPFQWKVSTPVPVNPDNTPTPVNSTKKTSLVATTKGGTSKSAAPSSAPKSTNEPSAANVPLGTTIYRIQLLATTVKLPDGVNFAGTTDQAAVVKTDKGLYLYSTGNFTNYNDALKYLNQLKAFGYTDAFIKSSKGTNSAPANQGHTFNDEAKPLPNQQKSSPVSQSGAVNKTTSSTVQMSTPEKKKV
jgi:hypothetical protein